MKASIIFVVVSMTIAATSHAQEHMRETAKMTAVTTHPKQHWVPPPYRYMPDRQVTGRRALGVAESWSPSSVATLIRRGHFVFDVGALVGLDDSLRRGVIEYVGAVADRIGQDARPPSFDQWILLEGQWGQERCGGQGQIKQWFPSSFDLKRTGPAPVPVKVLPSPTVVHSAVGPRLEQARADSAKELAVAGFRIGRTAVYEYGAIGPDFVEGKKNGARLFRILPLASPAVSCGISDVVQNRYAPQYGRLVIPNSTDAWGEVEHAFRRGGGAGSRYFGEIQTVELVPEVFVRRIHDAEGGALGSPTIVYELWDALEGLRCDAPAGIDPLSVRVTMTGPGADSKLGGHDLFRVPLPLPRAIVGSGPAANEHPQERIVIDESWSDVAVPIVAVRKGEGWEAYCESLVIDNDPKAELRDGSLLMLGVFSNITPEQLVDILAAFAGVDPAPIMADKDFIVTLRERYERLSPNR